MKKLIIVFLLIKILCPRSTEAQNFFPLPPGFNSSVRSLFYDTSSNILYAGGEFWKLAGNIIPMNGISQWNGNSWDSLGGLAGIVLTITKYNGYIYAGGNFVIKNSIGNYVIANIAYWDGVHWQLPQGSVYANSAVWELYADGNDLYVGGNFDTINGMAAQRIVRFDGSIWHSYPTINPSWGAVTSIAIYNSELYIGGNFDAGTGKEDIAKFDGTNWVSVGGGLSGSASIVDGMLVWQGELYIIGYFQPAWGDPGSCIAKWNGIAWSSLGTGVIGGQLFGITVFKNEIYVGGNFSTIGTLTSPFIAKWNGTDWNSLGVTFNNGVGCFASHGNDLYIGGGFITIDSDTMMKIARYSPPLGMEENTWSSGGITISPNPNNGNFSLTSLFNPIESIRLVDLSGRIIFSENKISRYTYECKLNSPGGIYIIEIFIHGNAYRSKIVVTH